MEHGVIAINQESIGEMAPGARCRNGVTGKALVSGWRGCEAQLCPLPLLRTPLSTPKLAVWLSGPAVQGMLVEQLE